MTPKKRVTIRDIARVLDISHSTVSRVLSGWTGGSISEETRERVLECSRRLGYAPNTSARALCTGRTGNIALFTPSLEERTGPHFARMLDRVERRASELNYRLLVCGQLSAIEGSGFADGVILLGRPDDATPQLSPDVRAIRVCHLPSPPESRRDLICWSDFKGARSGTEYLIGLGHRRICGIWGNAAPPPSDRSSKVDGYRAAMAANGLVAVERFGERAEDQVETGYILMQECLRETPDVTAVVARNDFLAVGCLQAILAAGLKVPDDISVLGYNDTILARYAAPKLTSVRTPIGAAGRLAVEALHRQIEDGTHGFEGAVLETEITERQSCAPPKRR